MPSDLESGDTVAAPGDDSDGGDATAGGLGVVDAALYRDREVLGQGGMGRIVTARDRRLGRTVAIKELRAQRPALRARFEREALLTAQLQHPAIVPVYEAGRWPSGEPFYAMKRVEGRSLDAVIAEAKTLAERIALVPNVIAVADALAYAHGRRVIHRDLKPANILVGDFGETVVIDWGLGKYLDAAEGDGAAPPPPASDAIAASDAPAADLATLDVAEHEVPSDAPAGESHDLTVAGHALGTPAYMPPEQARGEAVDERADVYAIGAVLYHVLAGEAPYAEAVSRSSSVDELLDAVLSSPPDALRELEPDVPRDLLTVVEKAMARDPAQRYATARELVEDLRRFQAGQLVGAHSYSAGQLLRRWLWRHRAAVAVAAAAALILVVVGVVSIQRIVREERRADRERRIAEHNRAEAEALMDFMLFELTDQLRPLGKLELLDSVAREASAYYERRGDAGDPAARHKRAEARAMLGDVLLSQGDAAAALVEYRAAIATLEELAARDPDDVDVQRDLAASHDGLGEVLLAQGDSAGALASFRSSRAIARALSEREPDEPRWQRRLSMSHDNVGNVLLDRGDTAAALAEYRASLAIVEELSARDPDDVGLQRDLSISHDSIGEVLLAQGDAEGADVHYRASLEIARALADRDPGNARWQRDLSVSHNNVGEVLVARGDTEGALEQYRASLAIREELAARDPTNAQWKRDVSVAHDNLGRVYLARGDLDAAGAAYRASLDIARALAERDPSNAGWQRDLALSRSNVGDVVLARGDAAAALEHYRAALVIREQLTARDPTNAEWRRDLSIGHQKVAEAHLARGATAAAAEAYRRSLEIRQALAEQDPTNTRLQQEVEQLRQSLPPAGGGQGGGTAIP